MTGAGGRPALGVSAIVAGPAGLVLVRRATAPYAGRWSLPGGRVEVGETLREAARREVREETGLEAEIGALHTAIDLIERGPGGDVAAHFVVVVFMAAETQGRLAAGGDAADARRFALGEIAALAMTPGTADLIRQALAGGA